MLSAISKEDAWYTAIAPSRQVTHLIYTYYKYEAVLTYRQKCFTWNVIIPSVWTGGFTNLTVLSVHSCDFSLELCNIFHSPESRFSNSLFPWKKSRGIVIFAGSKSSTLSDDNMWRTGPTNIPSPFGPMLGSSWTLRLSKRRWLDIHTNIVCFNCSLLRYST